MRIHLWHSAADIRPTAPEPRGARDSTASPRHAAAARVLAAAVLLALAGAFHPGDAFAVYPTAYQPPGLNVWDFWYAKKDTVYYAYYLQSPTFTAPTIGMATSTDLVHWTEHGEVLGPNPPGMWNDAWMATGSVFFSMGQWWMPFTGQTYTGVRGTGLATSHDLVNWTRIGNRPIRMQNRPFVVPESPYWQSKGFAAGAVMPYSLIADPYVIPEKIDGFFYLVANSLFDDVSIDYRGCICLMRSADGLAWEDLGLIAAPRQFNEMEAPQLWRHGDRWYLMFGAARYEPLYRANMVYTSPVITGPFEPGPHPQVTLPDYEGWFYVAKVLADPNGDDVLLGGLGGSLSHPYRVTYEPDGSLTLTQY
jgi:beta-fructofuranosidase